jgi:hypothetical protein
MRPDEGADHVLDRASVGRGVPGDSFQSVEGTYADVSDRAAQLIHSPGEPVSDLSFPADADLPPGCYGADHHQQPRQALQN